MNIALARKKVLIVGTPNSNWGILETAREHEIPSPVRSLANSSTCEVFKKYIQEIVHAQARMLQLDHILPKQGE